MLKSSKQEVIHPETSTNHITFTLDAVKIKNEEYPNAQASIQNYSSIDKIAKHSSDLHSHGPQMATQNLDTQTRYMHLHMQMYHVELSN